jgi:Trk K+ transport system NAD-binding subunit
MKDHIIVVGAGKFGSYLASNLSARGQDVFIIDKSKEAFNNLPEGFGGYEINDDAFELEVLEEAEVAKASQVIICTNSDNANIFLANICDAIYHVPQIFVRQSNEDKVSLLAGTKYKVIYPFNLSIQQYFNMVEGN